MGGMRSWLRGVAAAVLVGLQVWAFLGMAAAGPRDWLLLMAAWGLAALGFVMALVLFESPYARVRAVAAAVAISSAVSNPLVASWLRMLARASAAAAIPAT